MVPIMATEEKLSFAFEKLLEPAAGRPGHTDGGSVGHRLNVSVVFTSVPATLAALRKAAALAASLNACLTLVVPQVVPYPLPLSSPPVLVDFNERRFRVIASQIPVETTVRVYLCRERWEALTTVLRPHCLVVVGAPRRWWPTKEMRLAKRLKRAGYEVIVAGMEQEKNG
jgi:hypothetical protein